MCVHSMARSIHAPRRDANAGGLPGPQFQALPEPAPLPPLPRPAQQLQTEMPEAASMAPMAAPAGESSAQYQVHPGHPAELQQLVLRCAWLCCTKCAAKWEYVEGLRALHYVVCPCT